MKKQSTYILLTILTLVLGACTQRDLSGPVEEKVRPGTPIDFLYGQRNATRATSPLQAAEHYNFGVFCYMDTDPLTDVMDNYLVGYYDSIHAYDSHEGCTTWGDPTNPDYSYWMYEGMGYEDYHGHFAGQPMTDRYMSNHSHQYLRYWDHRSAYTTFYAYAPYIHGALTPTFDPRTHVLTMPDSTIVAGYDTRMDHESMYAASRVDAQGYGAPVVLVFHRLNARVRVCFWEDINGYSIEMLDLSPAYPGLYAATGIRTGAGTDADRYQYTRASRFSCGGATVDCSDVSAPVVQLTPSHPTTEPLHFELPSGTIGAERKYASFSPTTYYAIPKDEADSLVGLTFHVSYRLRSELGEAVDMYDATVHVPADKTQWQANTSYTYIFRITRNTNGRPGTPPEDIDPSDPNVPDGPNIYPIVFDNVDVKSWLPSENEFGF